MSAIEQLIETAWHHIRKDKPSDAMQLAKQAFAINPESPEVAHLLGVLASRDGKPEIGLPLLQKSIDKGGVTVRKLKDMAEALLLSGHAEAALQPLNDAISRFGASTELLGLKSAVELALSNWVEAEQSASAAIALQPNAMLWETNLSFAQLMQQRFASGFLNATARPSNLALNARCPALRHTPPSQVWLKGEQGIGDSLFYLRFMAPLAEQGWRFHLEAEPKLAVLLQKAPGVATVKEKNPCPTKEFWLNVGDLPIMALQQAQTLTPPPLPLQPDARLVEKYKKELAQLGPAPYIAVTWRGGPKGRKQQAGIRMLDKMVDPAQLGRALSGVNATVISLQRNPQLEESLAFSQAFGRKVADFSALNNNLPGMLALLSLVDQYVTVSNTNLHLRESLGLPSWVFVNHPYQDWRWLAEGAVSPWYPHANILRQSQQGDWNTAMQQLCEGLAAQFTPLPAEQITDNNQALVAQTSTSVPDSESIKQAFFARIVQEGWDAIEQNNIPLAIRKAQEVMSQQAEHPKALHLLGWAAVSDLKFELGCQVMKRVTELEPLSGVVWRDFIRSLTLSGQFERALAVADQCLLNPDLRGKSSLHYAKAATLFKMGREEEALIHYDATLAINPNNLDALTYGGMIRMKLGQGHARLGFKQNSARKACQHPSQIDVYCCPVLRGNIQGLNILITRDMGLGDELSYLRYLPWLIQAGAHITYWCGAKLLPLLQRMGWAINLIPDNQPRPDPSQFDLAFIVSELPYAVEHYSAPEVAPSLSLQVNTELVEKWRVWLAQQGPAPYIGINWRAGAATLDKSMSFKKLSKAIEPNVFAQSLSGVNATWISLQRNITQAELNAFEQNLNAPLVDAAGLTDDLDDLLALLSLLEANVGVSNTNMHLRAGLGLGSDVLVQNPGGDWRWGIEGARSPWFEQSNVYRQSIDGTWTQALSTLTQTLTQRFGNVTTTAHEQRSTHTTQTVASHTTRLIWITGGDISTRGDGQLTSQLASTRYRVLAPAHVLASQGWQSHYVSEAVSMAVGGWGSHVPQQGDTVIISKVFTEHALSLARDAKQRGARLIVDFCDNHLNNTKRGPLQKALLTMADLVITSTQALNEALGTVGRQADAVVSDPVEFNQGAIRFSPEATLKLLWFGHAVNIDTLAQAMPELAVLAQNIPLQLNVVTTLPNGQQDLNKITPAGLLATYTPWSVAATEAAIQDCDIVVIPTLQSEMKKAKSPNRLLEPLWAGRMVVAGQLPAYLHFADSAWVGKSISEGIQWCLANPEQVKARIAQGQADVEKYFTAQAIGQQWHDVFSKTASQDKVAATVLRPEAVKNSPSPLLKELAILTTQHPTLPSIAIRLIEPLAALEDYSVKLASGIQHQKLVIDYETLLMRDIIVVQRDFPSTDTLPLLKKLKALGKQLVYETDDAFHLIPESHSKAFHRAKAPAIFEFAKLADAITVSTEALAKEFKPHGKVTVVPNLLSPNLWNEALIQQRAQKRASLSGHLRIGLIGGSDHQHDLAMLAEVITALQQKYPTLEWVAYGDGASQLLKQHISAPQVTITPSNFDYRGHPTRLAEMAIDIALIPLVDDAFNACRSNLKYLELGFLGVAGIFSNTTSYNKSVIDGETGLLANNTTESWLNAIHQLIEDPALREKIAANAQKDVTTHGMLTSKKSGWQALLDKLK